MTMADPATHPLADETNPGSASSDAGPGAASENSLADQLAALQQDRDLQFDRFLRAQAEFENSRKRWQRELDEQRRFQSAPLVRDLLPALDNLRRAVEAARSVAGAETLVNGLELVLRQVDETFARHEVKPIASVGQPFDPHRHEALTQMASADHPPMTVLQELERGYQLHDRVLRPSKVIVSQAPPGG